MNNEYTVCLAPRFWIEKVIFGAICLVLGVWGIYDYTIAIPQQEKSWEWRKTLTVYQKIFDSWEEENLKELIKDAEKHIQEKIEAFQINKKNVPVYKDFENVNININPNLQDDESVIGFLYLATTVIKNEYQKTRKPNNLTLPEKLLPIKKFVFNGLNQVGGVEKPSDFDRYVQWAFISCLPYGLWIFLNTLSLGRKGKQYKLNTTEKTIKTPDGVYFYGEHSKSDELRVVSIDMSSWSSKTGSARKSWMAWLVTKHNKRICLDDFPYKNMWKIVGEIAHHFEPNKWSTDAKRFSENKKENK